MKDEEAPERKDERFAAGARGLGKRRQAFSLRARRSVPTLLLVTFAASSQAMTPFGTMAKRGSLSDSVYCGGKSDPIRRIDAFGRMTAPSGKKANLPLDDAEALEWVGLHSRGADLYIAYEADSAAEDGSRGVLCRYSAATLAKRWCTVIPGFNVIAAVGESGALYVAAIGVVGRIDPANGKYLWILKDLYERDPGFTAFRLPIERDGTVVFVASGGLPGEPLKRVVVRSNTGALLEIGPAPGSEKDYPDFDRVPEECHP